MIYLFIHFSNKFMTKYTVKIVKLTGSQFDVRKTNNANFITVFFSHILDYVAVTEVYHIA